MTKRKQIAFRCDLELVQELDSWANKLGMPREHLIKNLVRSGLDDLELAQSLGVVSIASFIRKKMERGHDIAQIIPSLG